MTFYKLVQKDGIVRNFRVNERGGYVREYNDAQPGNPGQQISNDLGYSGAMLWSNERCLARDIRQARARELYRTKKAERE